MKKAPMRRNADYRIRDKTIFGERKGSFSNNRKKSRTALQSVKKPDHQAAIGFFDGQKSPDELDFFDGPEPPPIEGSFCASKSLVYVILSAIEESK